MRADRAEDPEAKQMVRTQLASRDVRDPRVLAAMARIPRRLFVPSCRRGEGYGDYPLPIGHDQTISQPYMVGIMTQELHLSGAERVLEVGTGSGYQTAVLAELCHEVYTIERLQSLLVRAKGVLADLEYANVRFTHGDGSRGWVENAPYDRIIVTAAAAEIPRPLCSQLSEGGIMVIPVGNVRSYQRVVVVRRHGETWTTEEGLGCRFVPLVCGPQSRGRVGGIVQGPEVR